MSAKTDIDTIIFEDVNSDSGFISAPLGEEEVPSEDLTSMEDQVDSDKAVFSDCSKLDNDVDKYLAHCMTNIKLNDRTPSSQGPAIVVEGEKDNPLLNILFQQDDDGDTQLHIAAVHGCESSVGILIKMCPDKAWLDIPNDYGHTPLHLAVMSGHAVVTRMLVRAGASQAIRDVKGDTPLHKAVIGNHIQCIQALLSPIPEHPPNKLSTILNQKNYRGQTCVHMAATAGHIDAFKTLVYFGADINAREGLAGWTPLHVAARRGDLHLAQFLLQRCGGAEDARDYAGRTPRRLARSPRISALFTLDDDEDESDGEGYDSDSDSDGESLFSKLRQMTNPINVA